MSRLPERMMKWFAGFMVFAYRTLVLCFLFNAVLLFSLHSGAWFNHFMAFLMLCVPLVLMPVLRRLQRGERGQQA